MNRLAQTLARARALLLAKEKHRLGALLMLEELLFEAAGGDGALANDALLALDKLTPRPWTFSLWCQKAEWRDGDSHEIDYTHDRPDAEIAALINRARIRAMTRAQ